VLNGASSAAISADLAASLSLLQMYTPAQVAAMSSTNKTRKKFISLASTLDAYNNGIIGPGHCDENLTPATSPVLSDIMLNTEPIKIAESRSSAFDVNLRVAPNPANLQAVLSSEGYSDGGTWAIFDMTGRMVAHFKKAAGNESSEINLSGLSPGMYTVHLISSNGHSLAKTKIVVIR